MISGLVIGNAATNNNRNKIRSFETTHHNRRKSNAILAIEGIARQVCEEDKIELDKKQRIVYKTICATFLPGLIIDSLAGTTPLGRYLWVTVPTCDSDDIT